MNEINDSNFRKMKIMENEINDIADKNSKLNIEIRTLKNVVND